MTGPDDGTAGGAPSLTPGRILDTAEEVLRRFGPQKTTVVDVARALGVSHGSVYRHFASKAALRDAVTERWLARVAAPLGAWVVADGPALDRLRGWIGALAEAKRRKVLDDPELFATYQALAIEARDVVGAHVDHLADDVRRILADGVARGEVAVGDPPAAARAVLSSTARFHHPAFAEEWSAPDIEAQLEDVWVIVAGGLRAPTATSRPQREAPRPVRAPGSAGTR